MALGTAFSGGGGGSNVFGYRPATVPLPRPRSDLSAAVPQYGELTDLLSSTILNNLQGVLGDPFRRAVTDSLNARMVGLGVGGSPFANNAIALGLGREAQALSNLGVQQALNYFPIQSQTATLNPALQAQLNEYNSQVRAAPDPAARGQFEIDQFNKYLERVLNNNQGSALNPFSSSPGVSYSNLAGDSGGSYPSLFRNGSNREPSYFDLNFGNYDRNSGSQYSPSGGGYSLSPGFSRDPGPYLSEFTSPMVTGSGTSFGVPDSGYRFSSGYNQPAGPGFGPLGSFGNTPDNWMDLSVNDQNAYIDSILATSGINPLDYE